MRRPHPDNLTPQPLQHLHWLPGRCTSTINPIRSPDSVSFTFLSSAASNEHTPTLPSSPDPLTISKNHPIDFTSFNSSTTPTSPRHTSNASSSVGTRHPQPHINSHEFRQRNLPNRSTFNSRIVRQDKAPIHRLPHVHLHRIHPQPHCRLYRLQRISRPIPRISPMCNV